jgi:Ribosomal protein L7/L12 C-terminal domain
MDGWMDSFCFSVFDRFCCCSFSIISIGFVVILYSLFPLEVRSLLGLGLKEAKELVESVPVVLQKQIGTEAAEEIKAKLVAIGAQIELVS